jgi:hypothetical protein
MWWGINKAINLHGIKEGDGVDIRNCGDSLVAITVEIAVGVGIA